FENPIDLRHRVDVDDDPLVADGAEVVVGNVRAGKPDVVRRESGLASDEDLTGRHGVAAETGAAHEVEDAQRAIGLHRVKRAAGESGKCSLHALDLPPDDLRVVDV